MMVLTSDCTALITNQRLEELNDEYNENAIVVEVMSRPLDPDTDPVLLCERKIAREP